MSNPITKRFLGFPFILAGLFVVANAVELGKLECNRTASKQGTCQLTHSNLFNKNILSITEGQLKGAELQKKKRNYRIIILTQNSQIPLIHSYTIGKQRKIKKVNLINNFLSHSQATSLTVQQDNRLFGYLFGLIFIVSGICALFKPDLIIKK